MLVHLLEAEERANLMLEHSTENSPGGCKGGIGNIDKSKNIKQKFWLKVKSNNVYTINIR